MRHWRNSGLIVESPTSNDADQASVSGMVAPISVNKSHSRTNAPLFHPAVTRGNTTEYQTSIVIFSHLKSIIRNHDTIEKNALLVDRWQSAQWQA